VRELILQSRRSDFPWDSIDANTAHFLQWAESKLREEVRTQSRSILIAGEILLQVKAVLSHGHFVQFIELVMGYKIRTAQHYMSAHRAFAEGKSETIAPLRATAIYRLAAPSMPADEQKDILTELEGPNPDIPAIERRILGSKTKESSEGAPQALSVLQEIANLLKSNLSDDVFGEFCKLINHPALLASAKALSPHLQSVFVVPASETSRKPARALHERAVTS
jgi:hypothetical protein